MRLLYRERHKACVAGFFDGLCDEALVQRARAGQTAGQNLTLLVQKLLLVDEKDCFYFEWYYQKYLQR